MILEQNLEFFVIPPRSRLDCDPIKVGLITNRCLIRSSSPLERRTYAKDETKHIIFNPCELKPNLRFNRVSSVNRSFFLQKFVFRLHLGS